MKITEVKGICLGYEKPDPPMPRSFALVKVATDAGHVGYGEASTSYGHLYPFLVKEIVEEILGRVLVGRDPLDIKARKEDMYRYLSPWIGWEGISSQVIGAVEIALWDILGKERKESISHIMGCGNRAIPLYATGTLYFGDDRTYHGKYFDRALERGFIGVKTRIGKSVKADLDQICSVREHIGSDVKLMVDAYWSYSTQSAIELARGMEGLDIYFFEEPMPQAWLEGYARLCAISSIPIAVGERIYSLSGFAQVIRSRAADVLQPDPTVCGGISECMEVAALGKSSDRVVIPHIGGLTAVGIAANLHLASIIGSPMLEYDLGVLQPLRDEMLSDPVLSIDRIMNGCLAVPEGPGLGIEINESVFEKYVYKPGKVYPDFFPQFGIGKI